MELPFSYIGRIETKSTEGEINIILDTPMRLQSIGIKGVCLKITFKVDDKVYGHITLVNPSQWGWENPLILIPEIFVANKITINVTFSKIKRWKFWDKNQLECILGGFKIHERSPQV